MKDIWPSLLTLNLEEGGHESKNAGTALTNSQQGDRNFNPTTTRDCNSHLNEQRNRFSSRASVKEHSPADSLMLACWAHIGYRELWDDKHVLFKLLRLWWLLYSNRKPIESHMLLQSGMTGSGWPESPICRSGGWCQVSTEPLCPHGLLFSRVRAWATLPGIFRVPSRCEHSCKGPWNIAQNPSPPISIQQLRRSVQIQRGREIVSTPMGRDEKPQWEEAGNVWIRGICGHFSEPAISWKSCAIRY